MERENFVIDWDEPPASGLTKAYDMFDPPLFNVYLASALTGRTVEEQSEDATYRGRIVDVLEHYDYLGLFCKVYDPAKHTPPGSIETSEEVYVRDQGRTANADLVVFYLNAPSFGIGMEAQIAADACVPRVLIRPDGVATSRMILGAINPTIADIQFINLEDLEKKLSEAMGDIMGFLYECTLPRRKIISEGRFGRSNLSKYVFCQRILKQITLEEMATRTGMQPHWLAEIEKDAKKCCTLTTLQLELIAEVVESTFEMNDTDPLKMKPKECDLPGPVKDSLRNLYEFTTSKDKPLSDESILREWAIYWEEDVLPVKEAARGEAKELTVKDWKKRFESQTLF